MHLVNVSRVVVFLATILIPWNDAVSQESGEHLPLDSVAVGARVRVQTVAMERYQGFLRALTPELLRIKADFDIGLGRAPDTTRTISRANVRRAWVHTGSRWKKGAKLGALIGLAAGAVAGCFVGLIPEDHVCELVAPVGAGVVGLAGGVAGAAIGAHIRVWTPLEF